MKTTTQILQEALLKGLSITKFDFMNMTPTHSVCLAQRVEELRKSGWNILDRQVKGKGGLKEYYLEPSQISHLKKCDEQLLTENQNLAEMASKSLESENEAYFEQMGLGIPGGHNY